MLLEFCDAKHLCIANTWLRKADKKKITHGSGCNKSEIDFGILAFNRERRSQVLKKCQRDHSGVAT